MQKLGESEENVDTIELVECRKLQDDEAVREHG
jgi:hypothetical protein